jgi:hypothetical protein
MFKNAAARKKVLCGGVDMVLYGEVDQVPTCVFVLRGAA